MNVIDAAYRTVHSHPGGSASLAPRMGMSQAVLNSKVNPKTTTHHLSLAEADMVMEFTGDYQILQELAANHGFILATYDAGTDEACSLAVDLLRVSALDGEFARVVHDALADNIITANEMNAIGAAGNAHQAAMISLIKRLRGMTGKKVQA